MEYASASTRRAASYAPRRAGRGGVRLAIFSPFVIVKLSDAEHAFAGAACWFKSCSVLSKSIADA